MNCSICNLPTGNIVGSVLPQCKCGWKALNPPATQRPWVGLSNGEMIKLSELPLGNWDLILEVEAALKSKNT